MSSARARPRAAPVSEKGADERTIYIRGGVRETPRETHLREREKTKQKGESLSESPTRTHERSLDTHTHTHTHTTLKAPLYEELFSTTTRGTFSRLVRFLLVVVDEEREARERDERALRVTRLPAVFREL